MYRCSECCRNTEFTHGIKSNQVPMQNVRNAGPQYRNPSTVGTVLKIAGIATQSRILNSLCAPKNENKEGAQ